MSVSSRSLDAIPTHATVFFQRDVQVRGPNYFNIIRVTESISLGPRLSPVKHREFCGGCTIEVNFNHNSLILAPGELLFHYVTVIVYRSSSFLLTCIHPGADRNASKFKLTSRRNGRLWLSFDGKEFYKFSVRKSSVALSSSFKICTHFAS